MVWTVCQGRPLLLLGLFAVQAAIAEVARGVAAVVHVLSRTSSAVVTFSLAQLGLFFFLNTQKTTTNLPTA